MKIPSPGKRIYSINEGNWRSWTPGQRRLVEHLKGLDGQSPAPFAARYVGSMVADIHRTLLYGGLFMYPGDDESPGGKLRLLYEAEPMALIVERAGGRAIDGRRRILDVQPRELHERTLLYLGSAEYVGLAERFLAEDTESVSFALPTS